MTPTLRLMFPQPLRDTSLILLILLVLLMLIAFAHIGGWELWYFPFSVATAVVVRTLPVSPGRWLARRSWRRLLVLAIFVNAIAIAVWSGPQTLLLLLALAVLDIALGRASERLASAPDESVDERQEALRNRAHRLSYELLVIIVVTVVLASAFGQSAIREWLSHGVWIVGLLQLLFFLPAMFIAWLEPDRMEHPNARGWSRHGVAAALMVGAAIAVPFVLSALVVLMPLDEAATVTRHGGGCEYLEVHKHVGIGMGAELPISARVCWNGRTAAESWGLNASDCLPMRTDFVTVSQIECNREVDARGTLHYRYSARLTPVLLPFASRDVTLEAVVDRQGHVDKLS